MIKKFLCVLFQAPSNHTSVRKRLILFIGIFFVLSGSIQEAMAGEIKEATKMCATITAFLDLTGLMSGNGSVIIGSPLWCAGGFLGYVLFDSREPATSTNHGIPHESLSDVSSSQAKAVASFTNSSSDFEANQQVSGLAYR